MSIAWQRFLINFYLLCGAYIRNCDSTFLICSSEWQIDGVFFCIECTGFRCFAFREFPRLGKKANGTLFAAFRLLGSMRLPVVLFLHNRLRFLNQHTRGDFKRIGDFEQRIHANNPPSPFNHRQMAARNSRQARKLFLRDSPVGSKLTDYVSECFAVIGHFAFLLAFFPITTCVFRERSEKAGNSLYCVILA